MVVLAVGSGQWEDSAKENSQGQVSPFQWQAWEVGHSYNSMVKPLRKWQLVWRAGQPVCSIISTHRTGWGEVPWGWGQQREKGLCLLSVNVKNYRSLLAKPQVLKGSLHSAIMMWNHAMFLK